MQYLTISVQIFIFLIKFSIMATLVFEQRYPGVSVFLEKLVMKYDFMNQTIKKEALAISANRCEIVPAMLGNDIGDFAAIGVAKDYAEAEL